MRTQHPFRTDDLAELNGRLLCWADEVVGIRESIGMPNTWMGMRHDVDNLLAPAVAFAEWEAERGYRSTYYILHSAPYWEDKFALQSALERISECGHEIGFHTNALATALRTGRDPAEIVETSLAKLRGYGYDVTGVVAHGDPLCHQVPGGFVNDELFSECVRPSYGHPERTLEFGNRSLTIKRQPWSDFGLEYDPNWIGRGLEFSDSGGKLWSDFDEVVESFPYPNGQIQFLIHPCWWAEAFAAVTV